MAVEQSPESQEEYRAPERTQETITRRDGKKVDVHIQTKTVSVGDGKEVIIRKRIHHSEEHLPDHPPRRPIKH